jgi:Na+/H+ antiporter NhaD/arsenite permease-like protein
MPSQTHRFLTRLHDLQKGDAIRRASVLGRALFVVGLLLAIFVGYAVVFGLQPSLIAVASAGMGWVIAERNALRLRISQWPMFQKYIDWRRVEEDLTRDV